MNNYKGTETFQLLVKNFDSRAIIDDWLERNIQTDIRIRRAKTPGHVVIETKDVMFANSVRMFHPGCQVHIKE